MVLAFEGVSYTRGKFRLTANGIFEEGIHLVSGKIGSGKSTLAFLASGLVQPGAGTVYRTGIRKSLLSMQFPEYHTTGISLNDEVRSWGLDPEIILASCRLLDHWDQDIRVLSRGELKRLHLGCVMSADADLLILDEPFSALDCRERGACATGLQKDATVQLSSVRMNRRGCHRWISSGRWRMAAWSHVDGYRPRSPGGALHHVISGASLNRDWCLKISLLMRLSR